MNKVLLTILILSTYVNFLYGNTCSSAGDGDWTDAGSWNCDTGVGNPPTDSWNGGEYLIIDSGHTIAIPNDTKIDLTSSNIKELRIRGTLDFKSNAQLLLPAGAQIVLEEGGSIKTSNNSGNTLIEIGGNEVWGRACEGEGCTNGELTGPGTFDENSDPNAPLPITLLSFNSQTQQNEVLLSWATASEKDFDYFSIERSRNAKTFEEIGVVKGAGYNTTEVKKYSFIDVKPLNGRAYYRIKAVDLDGTFEIFDAIVVNHNNGKQVLQVYPNPLKGSGFSLLTDFKPSEGATIKVTDIAGAEILSTTVNESNLYQIRENLPPGIYIVLLNDQGRIDKSRIVVN